MNHIAQKTFAYRKDKVRAGKEAGMNASDVGDKRTNLREKAEAALSQELRVRHEIEILTAEQARQLIHELRVHQVELEMQNDELRRAQEALEALKDKYLDLYDFAPAGYVTLGENGLILEANLAACRLLGVDRQSLINERFSRFIAPDNQNGWYLLWNQLSKTRDRKRCELQLIRQDGVRLYAQLDSEIWDRGESGSVQTRIIISDITERKQAEDTIRASLGEKEVLIREIHHRAKNNLQVMSSLLHLQASHFPDIANRQIFKDAEARIKSMGLVHEMLYQSNALASIKIEEYVENLVASLYTSQVGTGKGIRLGIQIGDITLGIDTAVPLGLILTELLSNCLKHAFPDKRTDGEIRISLCSTGDNEFEMIVADNGIGLPEHVKWDEPDTLGFHLVHAFVDQLHGIVEMNCHGEGTEVRVRFKEFKRALRM